MNIFKKYILFILLSLSYGVAAHESSSGEEEYTGVLFSVFPSLEQAVQLSLIKRIVLQQQDLPELRHEYLPNYIKGITHVAYLITCLSELHKIENIKNVEERIDLDDVNIFNLAYNNDYYNALDYDLREAKLNSINCPNELEGKRFHQKAEVYKLKQDYLACIKANSTAIIDDSALAYLFILALNDLQIANIFNNNDELIENIFHSFIDLLLIKGKKNILNNLLFKNDLTYTLLEYLLEINFSETFYATTNDVYQTEITDTNFLLSLHDILITFFKEIPDSRLMENELGTFIMETVLPKIPYFNDENKQLLNSLFERGLTPNIVYGDMPYMYWLLSANLMAFHADQLRDQADVITYLIENGLDYNLIEQPILATDTPYARAAKTNYARLKAQYPEIIKQFEQAHQDYQQKKIREQSRTDSN